MTHLGSDDPLDDYPQIRAQLNEYLSAMATGDYTRFPQRRSWMRRVWDALTGIVYRLRRVFLGEAG